MRRHVAVLTSFVVFAACKSSTNPKPPAMSPEAGVSENAIVVVGGTGPDQSMVNDGHEIAVGFDGTNYLVVWTQPGGVTLDDLWGARMTAAGDVIGSPFPISTYPGDQQNPAVAFDGTNYLVVFQDHRAGQYMNIYAARVRADGTVLDPAGLPVATQIDHQARPAVAFDGTKFFAVWADHRNGKWDVYGAHVGTDGVVQEADGIPISVAAGHQTEPAIAFDGTNYLVVWSDSGVGSGDIYAARVSPAGVALEPNGFPVSGATNLQSAPSVAFDGQDFIVAWQDLRGGVATDVYAARVRSDGAVLDPSGIAVATGAGAQSVPAVAFDGAYTLVLWEDAGTTPARVYGARLDVTGEPLDAAGFLVADGTAGKSVAVASDRAGRALVAYDAVDAATGAVRLRARALTDWAILSVQKAGRGNGTITSSPDGIACGGTCSSRFDAPTDVSLTAAPDGDSVFGGWSGACSGMQGCVVTVDSAKSVTATFRPLYPLTVAIGSAVPGSVTSDPAGIDCGGTCSSRFVEGTPVRLTPRGVPGSSVFSAWSGDCSGASCTPVMDGPRSVTATFVPAYTVTLTPVGPGSGTLALGDAVCTAGSTCPVDVAVGTTATMTATASAGSVVKSVTGCTISAADPNVCTVSVTAPKYVSAKFEPSTIPLTAALSGNGAGTVSGGGLACTTGSSDRCSVAVQNPANTTGYNTVTLTATPSAGSVFKSWVGCTPVTGAPNTCTVTMSYERTVTAKFETSTLPLTAVTAGTGAGTVTGAGLTCTTGSSDGCVANVDNPANIIAYNTVTLTATPSAGSVFKSWVGCTPVTGAPNTCTVTVSGARTVTAKFETSTIPLTAVTAGTGAGTVTGAGLACTTGSSDGCVANVDNPANSIAYNTVTLTATPSAGSVFKSWTGCTSVPTPNTCAVTVSMARTVTAKFEPSTIPLTALTSGTGAGTVTGAGLACTTGSSDGCVANVDNPANSAAYNTVTLTASPLAGSVFKSWTGCTSVPTPNTCTVTVSMARTVTAKFEPSTFALNAFMSGTGTGTVSGGGIACTTGSDAGCVANVDNPANSTAYNTVTLTATPGADSVFKSWTGCTPVTGTPNACTVPMNMAKSVTAKFEPSTIPLTVAMIGTGSGTVTGAGLACTTGSDTGCAVGVENPANSTSYLTVTLTASPSAGSVFKSWTGCTAVAGTPNACTVSMSMAKTVMAKFEPSTIPLTASATGSGVGTITGAGLSCTTGSTDGCTAAVDNPDNTAAYQTVTLTATPDARSVFKSWIGCTPVVDQPNACTVSMNMAKSVTAKFEPNVLSLTVLLNGAGSGTVSGPGLSCSTGSTSGCTTNVPNPPNTAGYTTVTLTATPNAGSILSGWGSCTPVAGDPLSCTVYVNFPRSVTATFAVQ